ncbi:MAG: HAMP domain-containing protein [Pyrinomonadaceae bacterium MAG19_C2-C3]|nr:HAMP domain-containing protein [Pyrinomonadaceae bacterium MAG19_C2-C3]
MSYRTRLLIIFFGSALLVNGASVAFLYRESERDVYEEFRDKALSVAATTAVALDADLHRTLQTREDEGSDAYRKIEETLRRARDANRRDDTYVKFIYTVMPSKDDPAMLVFGVDPEESLADKSHLGDVYRVQKTHPITFGERRVDEDFYTDQWGTWLSAYEPIKDSSGKTVAMVVVDFSSSRVALKLRPLHLALALSVVICFCLALLIAVVHSAHVSRPLLALRDVVARIGKGDYAARIGVIRKDEFGEVAKAVNKMAEGLQERETIKSAFARYVSSHVLEEVLSSGQMPVVHGVSRRVTVLFSDIRGFTGTSEMMRPEQVVAMLNEYFKIMVDVVFRHHGMLDKFIGDGMMVIFGAPVDDPHQEEHAIRAALEMQQEVYKLCEKWELQGRSSIRIGIGINSGSAVVGNIGSDERLEYTAIGDTVNLASRLESATKELGVDILISEYTYDAVRGLFPAMPQGEVHVKGRQQPVMTYSVATQHPLHTNQRAEADMELTCV